MFFNDPEFAVEPHDIAPIKEFLLEALARKDRGDSGNYDVIVEQLEKRNDEEVLWKLLVGLCSCVSQLTNRTVKYQQLIQAIFGYNWTCNQKITSAYLNLLGYLVSSNATFLIPCFQFIVKSFGDLSMIRQSAQSLNGLDDNKSISSLLDNPIDIETEQKFERIHRTLFGIIQLAPTGQAELFPMLAQFFPHKRFSVDRLSGYVQHLLRICEYLPVLQPKILDLIVLKCLEVDVEIVIEDSGEVKIQEEYDGENADEMFLLDEEPDNGKNGSKYLNGSSQRSQNEHAGQRIPAEVAELADKLDALLVLFLQYIDKCVGTGEASERLFHQLLYTFEERVLVTHRSKFVQFVLFYFAGRSDRFSRALAGRLLRCFLDNASTPLKQQSAVLYLGSFLSRATFLPMSVISETIAELLHWCSHYLTQVKGDSELSSSLKPSDSLRSPQDSDKGSYIKALLSNPLAASSSSASTGSTTSSASSNSDKQITSSPPSSSSKLESPQALRSIPLLRRRTDATCHETFYYCMQAVLYVYCFHGTDLVAFDSTNGTTKYSRITMQHLERCIVSSLDPLRFCLASVRTEFLRLALHTGMLSAVCVGGISKDLLPSGDGNASASNNDGTAGSRAPIKIVIGQPGRRTVARSLSAGANPLDTFFPFDPCLLRRLHQPIESSYRIWAGVPGLDIGQLDEIDKTPSDGDEDDDVDMGCDASDADRASVASSGMRESDSQSNSQMGSTYGTQAMEHYYSSQSTSLASSTQPFGTYSSGTALMTAGSYSTSPNRSMEHAMQVEHEDDHHIPFTANNIFLSQHGGSSTGPAGAMPFRRPRQYSVGSTGSF